MNQVYMTEDRPRKIDCGLPSIPSSLYAREYYVPKENREERSREYFTPIVKGEDRSQLKYRTRSRNSSSESSKQVRFCNLCLTTFLKNPIITCFNQLL